MILSTKLPKNFRPLPATIGTTAYEYLTGHRKIENLVVDPNLLCAIDDKNDGSLLYVFTDHSSVAYTPVLN